MVNFSSLEEVYGSDFTLKYSEKNIQQEQMNKVQFDKNPLPLFLKDKGYNQEKCFQVQSFNSSSKELMEPDKRVFPLKDMIGTDRNYQLLQERGVQGRNEMIDKMNEIERIPQTQSNEVKKKLLMDKLNHLEREIRQYRKEYQYASGSPPPSKQQELIPQPSSPIKSIPIQEHFDNTLSPKNSQQDIVDLALFVFIGFVVIFFMDSVFKMGKMMGARKK